MTASSQNSSVETSSALRGAVRDGLLLQGPLAVLSALMLDGGTMLRVALIALVAQWTVSLIIWHLRGAAPTRTDLLFVRWGYVPLLVATIAAALLRMPQ